MIRLNLSSRICLLKVEQISPTRTLDNCRDEIWAWMATAGRGSDLDRAFQLSKTWTEERRGTLFRCRSSKVTICDLAVNCVKYGRIIGGSGI